MTLIDTMAAMAEKLPAMLDAAGARRASDDTFHVPLGDTDDFWVTSRPGAAFTYADAYGVVGTSHEFVEFVMATLNLSRPVMSGSDVVLRHRKRAVSFKGVLNAMVQACVTNGSPEPLDGSWDERCEDAYSKFTDL